MMLLNKLIVFVRFFGLFMPERKPHMEHRPSKLPLHKFSNALSMLKRDDE